MMNITNIKKDLSSKTYTKKATLNVIYSINIKRSLIQLKSNDSVCPTRLSTSPVTFYQNSNNATR